MKQQERQPGKQQLVMDNLAIVMCGTHARTMARTHGPTSAVQRVVDRREDRGSGARAQAHAVRNVEAA